MSTILEALRKLQTDREPATAVPPKREFKRSVVETRVRESMSRFEPKRLVRAGGVVGGLAVGMALGMYTFWSDPEDSTEGNVAPSAGTETATQIAQARPVPSRARLSGPPASPPPTRGRLSSPPDRRETSTPPPRREAPPAREAPQARQEGTNLNLVPRTPPRRPPSRSSVSPAPRIERPPEINFRPATAPAPSEAAAQRPSAAFGMPTERALPAPEPDVQASVQASTEPEPGLRPPSVPETRGTLSGPGVPESRTPPEEAAERPEPSVAAEDLRSLGFPPLSVEGVVWHPLPQRRRATVVVDGIRAEAVREQDLLQGVMIDRIDPGRVVFRIGSDRAPVSLGP